MSTGMFITSKERCMWWGNKTGAPLAIPAARYGMAVAVRIFVLGCVALLLQSCAGHYYNEQEQWWSSEGHHQIPSYDNYLDRFPRGEYARIAEERIRDIREYTAGIKEYVRQHGRKLPPDENEAVRKGLYQLLDPHHMGSASSNKESPSL